MLSCNGEPHVVEAQMDNDGWLNGFRVQALSSKKKEGSSWHFRTGKETQHRLDVLQFHVLRWFTMVERKTNFYDMSTVCIIETLLLVYYSKSESSNV